MPTNEDPRRLAYEAGLPMIAVSNGHGGFIKTTAFWHDDWNGEDEVRSAHIPAGVWFAAQAAETVVARTVGSGSGAQECLVFEEVGDAWDRYEANRAARAAA
jgi:hypothetical protein